MRKMALAAAAFIVAFPAYARAQQAPQQGKPITITLDWHEQQILGELIRTAGMGCDPTPEGQMRCHLGIEAKDLSDAIEAQLGTPQKK